MGQVRELSNKSGKGIFRDQLVTLGDLDDCKKELIAAFRHMLSESKGQQAKKWLKSYEVKKLLGISSGTLQTLRVSGTLPFTKIGGTLYYSSEDIEKMLGDKKKLLVNGPLSNRKY